jgi:hypothetical protein
VARLLPSLNAELVEGRVLSRVRSRVTRQQVLCRIGVVVLVGEFAVVEIDSRTGGNGGGVTELDERDLRAVFTLRLGGSHRVAAHDLEPEFLGLGLQGAVAKQDVLFIGHAVRAENEDLLREGADVVDCVQNTTVRYSE